MITLPQTLRRAVEHHPRAGKVLLGCGVVSSAWWVIIDVLLSQRYPGYSYIDQTVSELSAEGAPTRAASLALNSLPYTLLMAAFGVGVWAVAGGTRAGRITGALLVGNAIIGGAGGVLFPMAVRGADGDVRNAMHAPYGAASILLFLLMMGVGSRLLGTRFRSYSYGTIAVMLVFGILMGVQSGRMVADEPTPWMGLEERISVYATMLWLAVLSVGLLRTQGAFARRQPEKPAAPPQLMKAPR
jgi:hypothetical protein